MTASLMQVSDILALSFIRRQGPIERLVSYIM